MSSTPVLLGIDGGGTSTIAWLADAAGNVVGRGQAGPSNMKTVGQTAARAAIDQSIALAFTDAGVPPRKLEAACLGLAGFDRPPDREVLVGWSNEAEWAERLIFANDGELVIAAGTPEGWGLGVIAGTGSIAVGRTAAGASARAGGLGPLLGDEGSGYAVALEALRLVARRYDGRDPRPSPADALTIRLCRALGIESPGQLVTVIYAPGTDRTRIAALAADVAATADDDPEVERMILEPAGRELALAVAAVARSLGWDSGPVPLAMAGGFLLSAPAVAASLCNHLGRLGYQVSPTPVPEPVLGAVLLARRALERAAI